MDATSAPKVTVAQPGGGESVSIPGFGAVYKLYSRDNGGEVAIVEHPFAVGYLTAPHWHTREDEHSIVVEGEIGFRSDDAEVVLGPGGYITKPRRIVRFPIATTRSGRSPVASAMSASEHP
jgi:quercetin dioxygenase-like cupin family protein